ncbi:hypothetical protein [Microbacterium paraoxydans]|uniref:Uncharacterized protein n=1 Tax=Microbacterium paraoxydans TaxID=199592 RepID=A0ABS5IMQ2_9MICO|nr:hypothetical protein [Microbacterium paraoxydans]MBS0024224.1 hypothetical protein [Microbacterium paraoxydans]
MPPLATTRVPRARAERILLTRVVISVGLALLLVVAAWSTGHGAGDRHASTCLAVAAPAAAATTALPTAAADPAASAATPTDASGMDAVACTAAALCCLALVLLLRRLVRSAPGAPLGRAPRTSPAPRAAPRPRALTPSLTQLCLSRT